jgi:hypothetical protein
MVTFGSKHQMSQLLSLITSPIVIARLPLLSLPDSPYCHCPTPPIVIARLPLLSLPDSFGQSSNNAFKECLCCGHFLDHPDKPGDDCFVRRVMTALCAG